VRALSWPRTVDVFGPDILPSDILFASSVALAVFVGAALGVAMKTERPPAPEPLLAQHEVAVAVRPVSKTPGRRSGSAVSSTTPSTAPASPSIPGLAPTAPPSDGTEPLGPGPAATAVAPRPADAPPPSTGPLPPRPVGGIKELPRIDPPTTPLDGIDPDAATEPGFGVGGPGVAPGTADPETSPNDPYAYVDPALEQPGAGDGGAGLVGGGGEEPEGDEGDPLAARAVAAYRQRLQRWLSSQFSVTGTGLSAAELGKLSVRARIKLDEDRIVIDYAIEGDPHPALDAAARKVLDDVKGQQAPALPEHYPGPLQSWIRVTFVCSEDRCS
jgi:hypothetical protein